MKKKILALLVLGMIMINTTFANFSNNDVNKNVLMAFSQEFGNTSNVTWEQNEDYYKATFQLNGTFVFAFFSIEGKLMGTARNLTSNELPLYLQNELKKDYATFWISDLFEHAANGISSYYVTLENAEQTIILHSVGMTDWSLHKKSVK